MLLVPGYLYVSKFQTCVIYMTVTLYCGVYTFIVGRFRHVLFRKLILITLWTKKTLNDTEVEVVLLGEKSIIEILSWQTTTIELFLYEFK